MFVITLLQTLLQNVCNKKISMQKKREKYTKSSSTYYLKKKKERKERTSTLEMEIFLGLLNFLIFRKNPTVMIFATNKYFVVVNVKNTLHF